MSSLFQMLYKVVHWPPFAGLLLIAATLMAMVFANSALSGQYDLLISTHFSIALGDLKLDKPLLLWINDGLMAIFFFLVGLELKREVLAGQLSDPKNMILPAVGAVGRHGYSCCYLPAI